MQTILPMKKTHSWTRAVAAALAFSFCFVVATPMMFAQQFNGKIYEKENLVAWCIVPFDSQKRTPEQRAEMLEDLGIKRLAYDYRPEHIPTFEREIAALKKHGIELTAWWFPTQLNDEAKETLKLFAKHKLHPQLWVMGGGDPNMTPEQEKAFIASETQRIGEIARAAQEVGCKVALYNHGAWFGKPENQIKLIKALNMPNVGIVYNLHHAHDQLDRLPELLAEMKPYLLAINLNGTQTNGEAIGKKILPIGQGDRDVDIVKLIGSSGYDGPIGILNHTDEDARVRLQANLDGLSEVLKKTGTAK